MLSELKLNFELEKFCDLNLWDAVPRFVYKVSQAFTNVLVLSNSMSLSFHKGSDAMANTHASLREGGTSVLSKHSGVMLKQNA